MKKIKVIDKGIYSCCPEIEKKYTISIWAIAVSAVGVGLMLLWFLSPSVRANPSASGWVMGIGVCGLMVAVTLLFYYLVGDSKRPFYKPARSVMLRTERYYDGENASRAARYLAEGDFAAIANLQCAHQPLHLLVIYRSEGGELLAAQMVDETGVSPRAMGEIGVFKKGSYELPESLK